ncbi:MAG: host attachment protein [Devosia sp.]|nr:host attachment protein [Devosia sp.]
MKSSVTWVLIADGAQARILEYSGPSTGLVQVEGLKFEDARLRSGEIMADKPGRSYSSVGYGRSGMEQRTGPRDYRETEFLRSVADLLNRKCLEGAFRKLVIAAAPQALGDLRRFLSPATMEKVTAEIAKDLTTVPILQLGKHFEGALVLQ